MILPDKAIIRRDLEMLRDAPKAAHCIYFSIWTNMDGVDIPAVYKAAQKLTLVIEHVYWNMEIFEDRFEVDLQFGKGLYVHRCKIPLNAIAGWSNQTGTRGIQGSHGVRGPDGTRGMPGGRSYDVIDNPSTGGNVVSLDAFRRKQRNGKV